MKINIDAKNIALPDKQQDIDLNSPRHCPHCGANYNPHMLDAHYLEENNYEYGNLFVHYFCTACEKSFLCIYSANYLNQRGYQSSGNLSVIYPYPEDKRDFTENICWLSKRFVKIYNQAFIAEQRHLDEICGIGYRKALEFLIKDYVILTNISDIDHIKALPLAKCIDQYIDNKRIKTLATASAWIGNDETHYVRKHEDYDLESLKSFINATVSFIDSELEFFKADDLISKKGYK